MYPFKKSRLANQYDVILKSNLLFDKGKKKKVAMLSLLVFAGLGSLETSNFSPSQCQKATDCALFFVSELVDILLDISLTAETGLLVFHWGN